MVVIFGQNLEGCPVPPSRYGLNQIVVGPKGLIDFLETRLGLPPVISEPGTRRLNYQSALAACLSASPFYTKSFEADPFATTRQLLSWRDELAIEGWSPYSSESTPPRLQNLTEVEKHFENTGEDESLRLGAILTTLEAGAQPAISEIELLEPIEQHPGLWQRVLKRLPIRNSKFSLPESPLAEPGTVLHFAQQHLLEIPTGKIPPKDDSLNLVEATVLNHTALAAANHLNTLNSESACLISSPETLAPLDNAALSVGIPRVGRTQRTSTSALLQLAPLVIRLHWAPFNPQAWIAFFLHSISPLSPVVGRALANLLNRCPARNDSDWQSRIKEVIADLEPTRKIAIQRQVKDWLFPKEFESVADSKTLKASIDKLSNWMIRRASTHDQVVFLQASALLTPLSRSLGYSKQIDRLSVERIISEWMDHVALGESVAGELGTPHRIQTPAHLLEPADHVIWWQPRESVVRKRPWTRLELQWLADNRSIRFPNRKAQVIQSNNDTKRAILNAKKSTTVFQCIGDGQLEIPISPFLVRLKAVLAEAITLPPGEIIKTQKVAIQKLPAIQSTWHLKQPGLISPRNQESFSSLSKFINLPWEWVLDYQAGLRKGVVAEYQIIDDARRQGSLLHGFVESLLEPEPDPLEVDDRNRPLGGGNAESNQTAAPGLLATLIERLFSGKEPEDWKVISQSAIESWVEKHWNQILTQQAAHYLVPGNEASKSELLFVAKKGLWQLILQLRAARISTVVCEERVDDISFIGGNLGGIIDLRVVNEKGEIGVIDLKLGGKTTRIDELKKGRHLQLAIYGQLVKERHQAEPHAAYFIFSGGGSLIARSNLYFPKATIVSHKPIPSKQDWQYCWREFIQRYQQRKSELDGGKIVVPLDGYDPTLPYEWRTKDPAKYSEYRTLTGWSDSA